ncbi:MAG: trigger factor, partial [Firmicutes bacterium]|nr:trigger factor [Bacillota bacterium]
NAVLYKVVENAEVYIPEAMIEAQIDNFVNDFAQRLSYQGMTLETYAEYTSQTMEQIRAQFKERAEKQVNTSLVVEAITNAEGITATDDEVEMQIADMAKKYNMETDKIKELLGEKELENIRKDVALSNAVDMLVNKASVK